MANAETSCGSQSSSYYRDEGLLKGPKHYKDSMDDNVLFHQQSLRTHKMSSDNTTPEVITSSAADFVCDISSISSDAKYLYPEVDKILVPGKLSLLDID